MLEKIFHLKENHTDVKTELMAGVTTFMTMAYILAVNPSILSASGMDANAVLIATSLASFVGTALMALLANYPFALAPGMGLNAYFSYTVVLTMGYSWQLALMAVFVEGIIFIVLSLTNVREAIFNAIPMTLKSAVSVGIGLFVAFVGLQNAKLIVNSASTLVTYQHFKGETFHSIGVGAILTLVGVLITAILLVKKVKGGILYGILITWVLGILCELTGIYIPNPDAGMYSVIPTSFISFDFSALGKTFGQVFKTDFSGVGILNFFAVMFSFLFVDLFDTLGTLIGVASKADMLDEEGKLPNIKGALMADSIATCAGAVLGTSTTTTFVESASGVTEGGRTGLTSMTTGVLFLLAFAVLLILLRLLAKFLDLALKLPVLHGANAVGGALVGLLEGLIGGGMAVTSTMEYNNLSLFFAFASLFPDMTVLENLKIGAYLRKDDLTEDLNWVFDLFPRLKERSWQAGGTLSGGEQQMLAVGRALMSRPKVIMMDEPSLGLAPIIVKGIFEIIKEINKQGVTVLLIEQNANMALKTANLGYVMETGRITLHGSGEELLYADVDMAASARIRSARPYTSLRRTALYR